MVRPSDAPSEPSLPGGGFLFNVNLVFITTVIAYGLGFITAVLMARAHGDEGLGVTALARLLEERLSTRLLACVDRAKQRREKPHPEHTIAKQTYKVRYPGCKRRHRQIAPSQMFSLVKMKVFVAVKVVFG